MLSFQNAIYWLLFFKNQTLVCANRPISDLVSPAPQQPVLLVVFPIIHKLCKEQYIRMYTHNNRNNKKKAVDMTQNVVVADL